MKNRTIWGCYEQLRPDQIEAIQASTPIAYLPWGALEYHSYHNPVGLDGIKAHGLCVDLAKRVGGAVLPPVYQAANLIKSYPGVDFPKHSIEFSEELIRMTCREYFQQLAEAGFKITVLLTGHAGEPHIDILKEVAEEFNQKMDDCHFWSLAEFDILPDELLVANHSALGETSLQLVYAPETVALERLPQGREITLVQDGIAGKDPRGATLEHGQAIAEAFLDKAAGMLGELLKGLK
ncbi:MAG TPA: creatininase family protein [Bacteroidetes bacterium]|nr:creatininase family protein [Bacteroidota bacterium]